MGAFEQGWRGLRSASVPLTLALSLASAGAAQAAEPLFQLRIPPQPRKAALIELARQTGLSIGFQADLWLTKLLLILLDLFVAFFSFAMAIRVFNHVGYLINVPLSRGFKMICPAHVAVHLNRAGRFYSIGMRAYYTVVPLVFWLFGPHLMLISTVVLIVVLHRLDRAPKLPDVDYDTP